MDNFQKELSEATAHNAKSFSFATHKNYEIEFFKLDKKDKSYGVFIRKPNTNIMYKVGLIRNIDLLREAFGLGDTKCKLTE